MLNDSWEWKDRESPVESTKQARVCNCECRLRRAEDRLDQTDVLHEKQTSQVSRIWRETHACHLTHLLRDLTHPGPSHNMYRVSNSHNLLITIHHYLGLYWEALHWISGSRTPTAQPYNFDLRSRRSVLTTLYRPQHSFDHPGENWIWLPQGWTANLTYFYHYLTHIYYSSFRNLTHVPILPLAALRERACIRRDQESSRERACWLER